jgi:hypothetical protein
VTRPARSGRWPAAGPTAGRAGRAGEPGPARARRSPSAACAGGGAGPTRSGALAWVTPASGARCQVLAASVRALDDLELNDLLVELPVDRFDALLDAAFPTEEAAA